MPSTLFDPGNQSPHSGTPLAERLRPRQLSDFVGQRHLLGEGKPLRLMIQQDRLPSMLFWGPPGCGKTTLARLIAHQSKASFVEFSAVTSGVKEVRQIMEAARYRRLDEDRSSILFVDELHRFNRAQQDAFLPAVENGTIIFIGATTENPSFEVNSPLLSRCKLMVFQALNEEDLAEILARALQDADRGLATLKPEVPSDLLASIAAWSQGDARTALNTLQWCIESLGPDDKGRRVLTETHLQNVLGGHKPPRHDKKGEEHFNLISALHKSMRNSDPDASLYWLGRMLEGGEDPMYVVRRVVRFASEDIGLADPRALQIAVAARDALHFIGLPEGALALSQAVIYMATAPKSNALYSAYKKVQEAVRKTHGEPVPMSLRNPVTSLMESVGYGKDYQYAHDYPEAVTDLQCLPDRLKGTSFYQPGNRGFERTIQERMTFLADLRSRLAKKE